MAACRFKSKESIARSLARRPHFFPFLTGYSTSPDSIRSNEAQTKQARQLTTRSPDRRGLLGSLLSSTPRSVRTSLRFRFRDLVLDSERQRCWCSPHSRRIRRELLQPPQRTLTRGGRTFSGRSDAVDGAAGAVRVMQERFAKSAAEEPKNQERPQPHPAGRDGRDGAVPSGNEEALWESLWKDNITPWDLGRPAPVLVSELAHQYPTDVNELDRHAGNRTVRVLVPGCGAGYDLISLFVHFERLVAAHILEEATVVGLDLSPTSLSRASAVLEAFLESAPSAAAVGSTQILLVHGNYFDPSTAWTTRFAYGGASRVTAIPSQFDFLLDYTFFCALPPSAREQWGSRTSQLLHPSDGSRLLTLMFPVLEDRNAPIAGDDDGRLQKMKGPPFPVLPRDYQCALEPHSIFMESQPYASRDTDPTRVGKELVCWWRRRSTICSN